jgi:hypothetical protein
MAQFRRSGSIAMAFVATAVLLASSILIAQSDHTITLMAGGTWHLHNRIPLGSEALVLEPSHRAIQVLATAVAPQFEGWKLEGRRTNPVLLDVSGKPVKELPRTIDFRVTLSARDKIFDSNPLPLQSDRNLNDFLLGVHFQLQVFRGMNMREVTPAATKIIGIPADEPSDERIYRVSFDIGNARPDDRIVLLVTDASGNRISKFHLEFL